MHKRMAMRLMAAAIIAVLVIGCATTQFGGPKDKQGVEKTLADYKAALEKQDVDGMMALFSDSYTNDEGNSKEQVKEAFQGFKDNGYLEGATADYSAVKIAFDKEKGTATVEPVTLSSDAGSLTATFVMKKEGNAWRIVSGTMEQ